MRDLVGLVYHEAKEGKLPAATSVQTAQPGRHGPFPSEESVTAISFQLFSKPTLSPHPSFRRVREPHGNRHGRLPQWGPSCRLPFNHKQKGNPNDEPHA